MAQSKMFLYAVLCCLVRKKGIYTKYRRDGKGFQL